MIRVFVRARSICMDVEFTREMSQHVHCDPNIAAQATEIFTSKLRNRVFSDEDSAVLQRLVDIAESGDEENQGL